MNAADSLKGKRVTVMGLGRFGGGVGAVRFLAEQGARVTVTDLLFEDQLAPSLAQLDGCPIHAFHLGSHREEDFVNADLIVVNPGVRRDNRFLKLARQANVPLTTEICLFWRFNRGRVIGVTGSNGKSTTAGLIHSILQAAGFGCHLGGNIGGSLLTDVKRIQPDDWVVLELSSFQLDYLDRLPASPEIAVVTNFSPNHLDWHESLSDYRRAKQTILRWQPPCATAVLNRNDPDVAGWPHFGRRAWFGRADNGEPGVFRNSHAFVLRTADFEDEAPLDQWLKLPGRHNLENAMAATSAALAAGAGADAVRRGLESFSPLPHRLEKVAERAGRTFYNDSLATTPESAIVALEAFSAPIVLLAGGYDKGVDLSAFAQEISRRAKAVALMGTTAPMLEELIARQSTAAGPLIQRCQSFPEAFHWAVAQSHPGDIVLLSPGCASYDWFTNFAERGEQFAQLARGWSQS